MSAPAAPSRSVRAAEILGTPAYMSPEQMRDARTVDYRADIWGLSAVLYELVEGRLPFVADNFAELVIAVTIEQPQPMMLAPELRSVIERCLAKKVGDRFATVAELASALAPFGTPETAREYVARIHALIGDTPLPTQPIATPVPGSLRAVQLPAPGPETEIARGPSRSGDAVALAAATIDERPMQPVEQRPRRRSS